MTSKRALGEQITAAVVRRALRLRFNAPEWAMFEEVANATGYGAHRSADAVAMNLWPSRGLEIHGVEIKVSRADWVAERDNPAKADAIARYCNRWWLAVADASIVHPGELPPTWGLLTFRAGRLIAITEAPALDPAPLDRTFVAAMLRRAAETTKDSVPKTEIAARMAELVTAAREEGRASASPAGTLDRLAALEKSIADFEASSGVTLHQWHAGNIGAAVRTVMDGKNRLRRHRQHLQHALDQAHETYKLAKAQLDDLAQFDADDPK